MKSGLCNTLEIFEFKIGEEINKTYFLFNVFHILFKLTIYIIEESLINIFKEIHLSMKIQKKINDVISFDVVTYKETFDFLKFSHHEFCSTL